MSQYVEAREPSRIRSGRFVGEIRVGDSISPVLLYKTLRMSDCGLCELAMSVEEIHPVLKREPLTANAVPINGRDCFSSPHLHIQPSISSRGSDDHADAPRSGR
jgi:hypothetical protein